MADIVSSTKRSKIMSGIRGKDTQPELRIRKRLHSLGFRYVLHDRKLPGKPDMVFPKYRAVILVNGCFWHMHKCHLFRWPSTRKEFWRNKIERTWQRDRENLAALESMGWRVITVWECALKGKECLPFGTLINTLSAYLKGDDKKIEITGSSRRSR